MARFPYRACRIIWLSCCVVLAAPAVLAVDTDQPGVAARFVAGLESWLGAKCLTPAAGQSLSELIAAGGVQAVLSSDFTLVRGDIRVDQIELEIRDDGQRPYGVVLAFAGTRGGEPDGRGRNFLFYLTPSDAPRNDRARAALLAVAALFDRAIPDTAIQSCSSADTPRGERRYPRTLSLISAIVEALIVLTALLFGLWAVRRRV